MCLFEGVSSGEESVIVSSEESVIVSSKEGDALPQRIPPNHFVIGFTSTPSPSTHERIRSGSVRPSIPSTSKGIPLHSLHSP